MLINKAMTAGDVIAVRLTTGEELLGRLVEDSDASQSLTITKPILLQMQMVSQTQAGIGFAPFMVGVDDDAKITIPYTALLTRPIKARSDLANNYLKSTSGLDIPGGGLII